MTDKNPNIILIDDNEIDIKVNRKLLELSNITDTVYSFSSCKDAMAYIIQNMDELSIAENVLLLDIQMPLVDGFECLVQFEEMPDKLKDSFRIYMLSSSIDRKDIQRAESNARVQKVLEKPLDVYKLKQAIFDT